jgi:predicted extracellular nuclease
MAPWSQFVFALALCAALPAQGSIVISQVYGGGGNSGATYRNDFIELFNRGTNTVSVSGWSVQYASASGSNWQVTSLSGSIAPGQYYLVQQSAGASGGAALPTPDATGTISVSVTAGKIALVSNSVALAVSCPSGGANIADFVGYGVADCFETGPALRHSSTTSIRRNFNGCIDNDHNSLDFFEAAVLPRNSSSPALRCDTPPLAHSISEIQGTNILSPLLDQFVTTTTNTVTAVRNNGFFIQTPDENADENPLTSEGIFVLTGGAPAVSAGNAVVVSGTVVELKPPSDPASPARTQLNASETAVVSLSNSLPAAIIVAASDTRADGGLHQLERFEGMRVQFEWFKVTAPTEGFLDEPDAFAISTGVFYGTIDDVARPFREPGISVLDALPAGAPCCIPRFDENPELLRVDSNGQLGVSSLNVQSGGVFSNLTGVLFYESRRYTLLRDAVPLAFSGLPPERPLDLPAPDEVTVGALNLQRFYDDIEDTNVADVVLTSTAYSNRLHKASLLIRDEMGTPDILGLAEIENLTVLNDLAVSASPNYAAYLLEGSDFGGIDVGFLVNTTRVSVLEVRQEGKTNLFSFEGGTPRLHDRPPLILRARVTDPFTTNRFEFTVIMNHLRSMIGIDDATDGDFVRAKRRAQAEYVARLVQQLQSAGEQVLVMGDFNAFEFNDGYVDVLGTITGLPAATNQVLLASPDLVNPNLVNLIETLPSSERYSYVFDGMPQAIDHALVTENLRPRVSRFLYLRVNADFPAPLRNVIDRPERISDHDPALVYLRVGTLPRIAGLTRNAADVVIEGEGPPGQQYDIERSSDLITWQKIGSAVPDGTQRFSFRDLNPVSGAAFYRLRATDQN